MYFESYEFYICNNSLHYLVNICMGFLCFCSRKLKSPEVYLLEMHWSNEKQTSLSVPLMVSFFFSSIKFSCGPLFQSLRQTSSLEQSQYVSQIVDFCIPRYVLLVLTSKLGELGCLDEWINDYLLYILQKCQHFLFGMI